VLTQLVFETFLCGPVRIERHGRHKALLDLHSPSDCCGSVERKFGRRLGHDVPWVKA
jgi:hypothetical protein